MLKSVLKAIFGDKHSRTYKELQPVVQEINEHYEPLASLSDFELKEKVKGFKEYLNNETAEIRGKLDELRDQLTNVEGDVANATVIHDEIETLEKELDDKYEDLLDEILPEVFAVAKDTCRRLVGKTYTVMGQKVTWDMVPYDVQLMGGIVLHQGKIAEMATGEGKTLVATLPLFLNCLTGRGAHLVTVNDYLAQRDSEWMGEIFKFHDLTVGAILGTMNPDKRRESYNCDITYGTNNEFGFDYLRDNMAIDPEHQVQRKYIYAIVDEVDSVLIDEARTPLIISGPVDSDNQKYDEMKPKIERLYRLQSNIVSGILTEAEKTLTSNPSKDDVTEAGVKIFRAYRGLPKHKKLMKVLSEPEYKQLMQNTELEYLKDKSRNMHIIDEELYFVIDEKNNSIELTEKGREELAKGTPEGKEFFVLPDFGTEISKIKNDTSLTEEQKKKKEETLHFDYSEKSDRLHTINQLLKAYTLFEKDDEYVITEDGKIAIVDEFTGRVLPGRRYSDGLHQAIEAKENVKVERDTQTLATITLQNYFRMYKKLAGMTGTAETEEGEFDEIYKLDVVVIPTNKPITRSDEDDQIYRTKREKLNAVAMQVEELQKEGRPVLVGTTSVEVSETISRMLKLRGVKHNVLNAKQHQREAEVVAFAGQPGAVTIATNMAGRGTDIKLGAGVTDKGGLFILGTERHESRRIDRQLRGRAGRQGDPGTTLFFLSLEDDLLRLFGSDRAAAIMSRAGFEEGEVIKHPIITRSVERAQKKVEENNFAIRKRLLEYDNTMNQQRTIIYSRRNRALHGERLKTEILEMMEEYIAELVDKYYENADIELLEKDLDTHLLLNIKFDRGEWELLNKNGVTEKVIKVAHEYYAHKENMLSSDMMARIERYAFLTIIDNKWKEHLRDMDDLKEGINLRAYGQKDPLIEYKNEAFNLFTELLDTIRNETVQIAFKLYPAQPESVQISRRVERRPTRTIKESADNAGMHGGYVPAPQEQETSPVGKPQPVKIGERIGRNDPCWCGSGKKYKQCHGKNA